MRTNSLFAIIILMVFACSKESLNESESSQNTNSLEAFSSVKAVFNNNLRIDSPFNYSKQFKPSYIVADNSSSVIMDDKIATLGRVLFYDKNLSVNNTISCGSCHKQEFAFGDTAVQSLGVNGVTKRHSMRLINQRFSNDNRVFWDATINSLDDGITVPIADFAEMGFSGTSGNPGLNELIIKLKVIKYYKELSNWAFGDSLISEARLRMAVGQFVRSMQSFDSKFDVELAKAGSDNVDFTNFTSQENIGKTIYLKNLSQTNSIAAGGCNLCHSSPNFGYRGSFGNNGIVGVAGNRNGFDFSVVRSPTLRDVFNPSGKSNGPFMHDGSLNTLEKVIDHYNSIPNNPLNTKLDDKLKANGKPILLNLTKQEKDALVAFIKTLTGSDLYKNPKWSNPFK